MADVKLPEPWRWSPALEGEMAEMNHNVLRESPQPGPRDGLLRQTSVDVDGGDLRVTETEYRPGAKCLESRIPFALVLRFAARHAPAALLRAAAEVLRGPRISAHDTARRVDLEAARLEADAGGRNGT